jgi:thiamine-phosphate pyrophosphorylase
LLLYYITDRSQFAGNHEHQLEQVLERMEWAARCGVDFVQLREKDLDGRDLEALAHAAMERIRRAGTATRLLINSRTDIAIAAAADGVHLRSRDVSPVDARKTWRAARIEPAPVIAVSCHTEEEAAASKSAGADFAVFGPVFGKKDVAEIPAVGLEPLRQACRYGIPILALGGITAENAAACMQAGAKGIAGIRLFQEGDLESTVRQIRSSSR